MKQLFVILLTAIFCTLPLNAVEPTVHYDHRFLNYHFHMKLSRLKTFERLLPNDLRREIGEEYYPQIKNGLLKSDTTVFKDAEVSIIEKDGDVFSFSLAFPKFYMTFKDVTWADLDGLFQRYFNPQRISDSEASDK